MEIKFQEKSSIKEDFDISDERGNVLMEHMARIISSQKEKDETFSITATVVELARPCETIEEFAAIMSAFLSYAVGNSTTTVEIINS